MISHFIAYVLGAASVIAWQNRAAIKNWFVSLGKPKV